ncbi:putative sensory box sensor histidine kinase/response regulator [Lentisphaera araneosa HTCC2155]|uniref:histidine kinase n=1 Tax=Lentisphaera araneosa HTCC2155 TaxID=313628 RepID=A6DP28_9BACT|nr:HAMP domain-containing sensor histidine kinase [Lentisphaera araneosa]EDM26560.1 putative sensory box sensor histidine kinase/response regulator [Lentisphaera araneosa HTCC2155]
MNIKTNHNALPPYDNESIINTLAMVAMSTENAVIVTDATGHIEWVNEGFTRITEYQLYEIIGKKPGDFLQGEKSSLQTRENIRKALIEQKPITVEILNYSKSGREYWLNMNIQPIFDKNNILQKFIAIELDVTVQKKIEIKIKKLNQELTDALESKNKIFSIISHDLRAPFNSLIGLMEIFINDDVQYSQKDMKSILREIYESSKLTFNLLENLLNWSRSQNGTITCHPSFCNLSQILNEVQIILQLNFHKKEIELEIDCNKDINAFFDREMIISVLQNLLSNAIKFSNRKSKVVINVNPTKNHMLQICIIDSGLGIDKNQLENIFKIKGIKKNFGTEGEEGSGLGLLLCKDFIDLNNGVMECTSKLGHGTCFTIYLPLNENLCNN